MSKIPSAKIKNPTRRSFNAFSVFIPSVRKTLFFQKKIKLFNVQFIVPTDYSAKFFKYFVIVRFGLTEAGKCSK